MGWIEGRNLHTDYRWTTGGDAEVRLYAAELVALAPDVIVATGSPPVVALRQASRIVPIVFVLVADPVGAGFVESGARPGGNATGFTFEYTIGAKWLEVLREVAPRVRRVAVLREATNPGGIGQFVAIQSAAATHGGASHRRGFRCRRDLAGTLPADRLDDLAHKLDVGIILGERLLSELIINLKTAAPRPSTHDREDP